MDYSAEERFVRSFVVRERQERLLYELTRPKKRYDGLSRFCHTAELLLDKRRILLSGTDLYRQEAFCSFLARHGGDGRERAGRIEASCVKKQEELKPTARKSRKN